MCNKKIGVAGVGVGPVCGVDRVSKVHFERVAGGKESVDEYLNDDVRGGS